MSIEFRIWLLFFVCAEGGAVRFMDASVFEFTILKTWSVKCENSNNISTIDKVFHVMFILGVESDNENNKTTLSLSHLF